MKTEKVAIIGAGPAGISTAIQLKRYGINPVLFEKGEVGGLLKNANLVENYPGFPEGISGLNLIELFKKQLKNLSLKIFYEEIKRLDYANNIFLLKTPEKLFYSSIVVIASGTKPKRPTHFEISENAKNKIFYEVYPLLKVKKKQIIIIGAGDAAFDYALNLAKNNKITILNRSKRLKCLPLLWRKIRSLPEVTYREQIKISKISDNKGKLILKCKNNLKFFADYVIFAIGREPELSYFSQTLKKKSSDMENKGLLYFVGDVKNGIFRQTAIAVGNGIYTGMKIYQRLKGVNDENHCFCR